MDSLEKNLEELSNRISSEEFDMIFEDVDWSIFADDYVNEDGAFQTKPKDNAVPQESDFEKTWRHKNETVLLRSLRILLCLELLEKGYTKYNETFEMDWKKIIECIGFLEGEFVDIEIPSKVISDAVDLILLLGSQNRAKLLKRLPVNVRRKVGQEKPLHGDVVENALKMLIYCVKTERLAEAGTIAESLVALSIERNIFYPDKHRKIVQRVLSLTVWFDYPLTRRMGTSQQKYFKGVTTFDASRFYWYYGSALMQLKDEKKGMEAWKQCYEICQKIGDNRSWISAKVGIMVNIQAVYEGTNGEQAESYLWDAVRKIDERYYTDMEEDAEYVAALTRFELFHKRINDKNLRGLLPEIEKYYAYCKRTNDRATHPRLTIRAAENILGGYYSEVGDHLKAIEHFWNAFYTPQPNGLPDVMEEDLLYSNLLIEYNALNDRREVARIAQILRNNIKKYEKQDETYKTIYGVLQYVEMMKFTTDRDAIDEARRELKHIYDEMRAEERKRKWHIKKMTYDNVEKASEALWRIFRVLPYASTEELKQYRKMLWMILNDSKKYTFGIGKYVMAYHILVECDWKLNDTKVYDSIRMYLEYSERTGSSEVQSEAFCFVSGIYLDLGNESLAQEYANKALCAMTKTWQDVIKYPNNHRVYEMLSNTQRHFRICYQILRNIPKITDAELYEQILRFKNLSSLVLRERNRISEKVLSNEGENGNLNLLKNEIYAEQDGIVSAALQEKNLKGEESSDFKQSRRILGLEEAYTKRFPMDMDFTEISYSKFAEKLPECTAVVEYFFTSKNEVMKMTFSELDEEQSLAWDDMELDIFVTVKINGNVQTERWTVLLDNKFGDILGTYLSLFQNGEQKEKNGEQEEKRISAESKEILCGNLYKALIQPIESKLNGVQTVYLASDSDLSALQIEMLHEKGNVDTLGNSYNVRRVMCGRDLLFFDNKKNTNSQTRPCLLVGGIDYGKELVEKPARRLYGSPEEVERIARKCGCAAQTGKTATKEWLKKELAQTPYRIIHLSTHGIFDEEEEAVPMFTAGVIMAGYNDWKAGKKDKSDNAILTADEISRMDLRNTELVVLSTCVSGRLDSSLGCELGLVSAFSAAGVHWVVCHLWEEDDYSGPVFMDAFYEAYLSGKYDVPEAVKYAQDYLKSVTLKELRDKNWLLAEIVDRNEDDYSDERNWAGFICYKCR